MAIAIRAGFSYEMTYRL